MIHDKNLQMNASNSATSHEVSSSPSVSSFGQDASASFAHTFSCASTTAENNKNNNNNSNANNVCSAATGNENNSKSSASSPSESSSPKITIDFSIKFISRDDTHPETESRCVIIELPSDLKRLENEPVYAVSTYRGTDRRLITARARAVPTPTKIIELVESIVNTKILTKSNESLCTLFDAVRSNGNVALQEFHRSNPSCCVYGQKVATCWKEPAEQQFVEAFHDKNLVETIISEKNNESKNEGFNHAEFFKYFVLFDEENGNVEVHRPMQALRPEEPSTLACEGRFVSLCTFLRNLLTSLDSFYSAFQLPFGGFYRLEQLADENIILSPTGTVRLSVVAKEVISSAFWKHFIITNTKNNDEKNEKDKYNFLYLGKIVRDFVELREFLVDFFFAVRSDNFFWQLLPLFESFIKFLNDCVFKHVHQHQPLDSSFNLDLRNKPWQHQLLTPSEIKDRFINPLLLSLSNCQAEFNMKANKTEFFSQRLQKLQELSRNNNIDVQSPEGNNTTGGQRELLSLPPADEPVCNVHCQQPPSNIPTSDWSGFGQTIATPPVPLQQQLQSPPPPQLVQENQMDTNTTPALLNAVGSSDNNSSNVEIQGDGANNTDIRVNDEHEEDEEEEKTEEDRQGKEQKEDEEDEDIEQYQKRAEEKSVKSRYSTCLALYRSPEPDKGEKEYIGRNRHEINFEKTIECRTVGWCLVRGDNKKEPVVVVVDPATNMQFIRKPGSHFSRVLIEHYVMDNLPEGFLAAHCRYTTGTTPAPGAVGPKDEPHTHLFMDLASGLNGSRKSRGHVGVEEVNKNDKTKNNKRAAKKPVMMWAPREFKCVLFQLLLEIRKLHDAGIIHFDLKSDNFFVDSIGLTSLIDFGCSFDWKHFVKHFRRKLLLMLEAGKLIIGDLSEHLNLDDGDDIDDEQNKDQTDDSNIFIYKQLDRSCMKFFIGQIRGKLNKSIAPPQQYTKDDIKKIIDEILPELKDDDDDEKNSPAFYEGFFGRPAACCSPTRFSLKSAEMHTDAQGRSKFDVLVSGKSDVWSVGLLVMFLLARMNPFSEDKDNNKDEDAKSNKPEEDKSVAIRRRALEEYEKQQQNDEEITVIVPGNDDEINVSSFDDSDYEPDVEQVEIHKNDGENDEVDFEDGDTSNVNTAPPPSESHPETGAEKPTDENDTQQQQQPHLLAPDQLPFEKRFTSIFARANDGREFDEDESVPLRDHEHPFRVFVEGPALFRHSAKCQKRCEVDACSKRVCAHRKTHSCSLAHHDDFCEKPCVWDTNDIIFSPHVFYEQPNAYDAEERVFWSASMELVHPTPRGANSQKPSTFQMQLIQQNHYTELACGLLIVHEDGEATFDCFKRDLAGAQARFAAIVLDKTGNDWSFVKTELARDFAWQELQYRLIKQKKVSSKENKNGETKNVDDGITTKICINLLDKRHRAPLVNRIVQRGEKAVYARDVPVNISLFSKDDANEVLDFVELCLTLDPKKRPTIQQLLDDKFFNEVRSASPTSPSLQQQRKEEKEPSSPSETNSSLRTQPGLSSTQNHQVVEKKNSNDDDDDDDYSQSSERITNSSASSPSTQNHVDPMNNNNNNSTNVG